MLSSMDSVVIIQIQLPEQFVRQCISAAGIRGGVFHEKIKHSLKRQNPAFIFPSTPEMERLDSLLTFPSSLGVRVVM